MFQIIKMSLTILAKKWPSVKSALRPTPSAQAENEKSALFPGKRAEIYSTMFCTWFTLIFFNMLLLLLG